MWIWWNLRSPTIPCGGDIDRIRAVAHEVRQQGCGPTFFDGSRHICRGIVFHRFNPVLVDKSAETSLSGYKALPVSLIGSKAIMVPLGLAMATVSILILIDRGSATQRFIYMIF